MPRLTKDLPKDRSDYSFGDLVYWHLFKYGTRPAGDPADDVGRPWRMGKICAAIGVKERTVRYWIGDEHLPDDISRLCTALFGDNKRWDKARLELQEKLEKGWAAKGRKADSAPRTAPTEDTALSPEQPESAGPAGDAGLVDEADEEAVPEPEAGRPEAPDGEQDEPPEPPAPETMQSYAPRAPESGPRLPRHAVRAFIAGMAVLLGIYGWVQWRNGERPSLTPQKPVAEITPPPKAPTPVVQVVEAPRPPPAAPASTAAPIPAPAPTKQAMAPPTEPPAPRQETPASPRQNPEPSKPEALAVPAPSQYGPAQEEKKAAARPAAPDLDIPRPDRKTDLLDSPPPSARMPSGIVSGDLLPPPRPAQTRPANTPPSPAEEIPPCPRVSGFRLTCDTIMDGGTALGSARLSYLVSTVNECATKCRPIAACVGFRFNARDPEGQHSCVIFGGRPETRPSPGWITGER